MDKKSIFINMNVDEFREGILKFIVENNLSKSAIKKFKRYDSVPLIFKEKLESNKLIPLGTKHLTAAEMLKLIQENYRI